MCLSLLRRNALIIRKIQYASDHVSERGQMWRKMYDSSSLLKFFWEALADFAVMTMWLFWILQQILFFSHGSQKQSASASSAWGYMKLSWLVTLWLFWTLQQILLFSCGSQKKSPSVLAPACGYVKLSGLVTLRLFRVSAANASVCAQIAEEVCQCICSLWLHELAPNTKHTFSKLQKPYNKIHATT